jgi:type IV secretory pathway VirB6-like protein
MAVFNDIIYTNVLDKIITTYEKIPPFIAAPVLNIILLGVVISITYQGLEVIRGAGGANPILDVIAKNMRPLFVLLFAASIQGYSDNIRPFIKEDVPIFFVNAVESAGGLTVLPPTTNTNRAIFQSLDININTQLGQLKRIADEAKNHIFAISLGWQTWFTLFGVDVDFPFPDVDVTGIPALLIAGIIFLVIVAGAVIVCLQASFIVIAWNFVLAFGPIFLAMYAFEKTEKYALHWIESVLKYTFALIVLIILYTIFASQLTAAMIDFANRYIAAPKNVGDFLQSALSPIAISIVSAYILTKADQLAQDLIGGGISGSGGFAQSMGGRISGAAKSVVGAAGAAAGLAYAGTLGKGHTSPLAQWKDNKRSDAADDRRKAREKKSSPASSVLAASMRNSQAR